MRHLQLRWRVLDRQVIAVATERIEGTWCAYIGAVPGENHDVEWQKVRDHGSKLPATVAQAIFLIEPFTSLPYAP